MPPTRGGGELLVEVGEVEAGVRGGEGGDGGRAGVGDPTGGVGGGIVKGGGDGFGGEGLTESV